MFDMIIGNILVWLLGSGTPNVNNLSVYCFNNVDESRSITLFARKSETDTIISQLGWTRNNISVFEMML